jgi:uncharacterized membrane protein
MVITAAAIVRIVFIILYPLFVERGKYSANRMKNKMFSFFLMIIRTGTALSVPPSAVYKKSYRYKNIVKR